MMIISCICGRRQGKSTSIGGYTNHKLFRRAATLQPILDTKIYGLDYLLQQLYIIFIDNNKTESK